MRRDARGRLRAKAHHNRGGRHVGGVERDGVVEVVVAGEVEVHEAVAVEVNELNATRLIAVGEGEEL